MSDIDGAEAPSTEAPEGAEVTETDDELVPVSKLRELRDENKKYREKFQPFERALADFEDADRDFLLTWLPTYQSNPDEFLATAKQIVTTLEGLTPEQERQVAEDVATAEAEADKAGVALTPEKVEEIINSRLEAKEATQREQAEKARAIDAVNKSVEDKGFTIGTPDFRDVLYRMANETEGDLEAAVKSHNDWKQSLIDGALAKKDAPIPPSGGDAPAPVRDTPKNVKEAHTAALAAIRGQ